MVTCWLFNYRNKLDVSIHYSWLNSVVLGVVRLLSLGAIILRFASFLGDEQNSLIYLTYFGFTLSWIYFGIVNVDLLTSRLILKSESKVSKFVGECINLIY